MPYTVRSLGRRVHGQLQYILAGVDFNALQWDFRYNDRECHVGLDLPVRVGPCAAHSHRNL